MIEFDEPLPRRPYESIVPLINVVFLLLIFFLLAGTMGPSETVKVNLPVGTLDDKNKRQPAMIYMEQDGFMWLGKTFVAPEAAGFMVRDFIRDAGTDRVAVKVDEAAPADALLTLMEVLRIADVKEVTILTERAR
ncbi:MAG TPA: biopolymer transporter ExbD [Parvibaculum sp.]|uniref:ExbD/TolR family protein n=1 Tax=Parvibaculum sp. TaxID=2024848 RepID=UPI002B7EAA25|nr:biopolymer transporter ExbD [Parvibaculum sp.]HMM13429.1 biopolymer transporter ExbD [Parvibaculum sp.]